MKTPAEKYQERCEKEYKTQQKIIELYRAAFIHMLNEAGYPEGAETDYYCFLVEEGLFPDGPSFEDVM